MTKVVFTQADGSVHEIDAEEGSSVMRTAIMNGVTGIQAECGGELSCATCHVYVEETWLEKLDEPSLDEEDMLEFTESERLHNSRLSCQIALEPELDGLPVTIPEEQ